MDNPLLASLSQTELDALRASITPQLEALLIDELQEIGALQSCYAPGGGCQQSCPAGYKCVKTIRNNCVCTRE